MTLLGQIKSSLGLANDSDESPDVHFLGAAESACLQELHGEPVLVVDAGDEAAVLDLDEPTANELQLALGEFEIDYLREDGPDSTKHAQPEREVA